MVVQISDLHSSSCCSRFREQVVVLLEMIMVAQISGLHSSSCCSRLKERSVVPLGTGGHSLFWSSFYNLWLKVREQVVVSLGMDGRSTFWSCTIENGWSFSSWNLVFFLVLAWILSFYARLDLIPPSRPSRFRSHHS